MSTNVSTANKKVDLIIRFNGQDMSLKQVMLRAAKMKAHNMVRQYLLHEYMKKEATAQIMLKDSYSCVSEIHGFRKCGLGAINIIHSDSPDTNRYSYRRL